MREGKRESQCLWTLHAYSPMNLLTLVLLLFVCGCFIEISAQTPSVIVSGIEWKRTHRKCHTDTKRNKCFYKQTLLSSFDTLDYRLFPIHPTHPEDIYSPRAILSISWKRKYFISALCQGTQIGYVLRLNLVCTPKKAIWLCLHVLMIFIAPI